MSWIIIFIVIIMYNQMYFRSSYFAKKTYQKKLMLKWNNFQDKMSPA